MQTGWAGAVTKVLADALGHPLGRVVRRRLARVGYVKVRVGLRAVGLHEHMQRHRILSGHVLHCEDLGPVLVYKLAAWVAEEDLDGEGDLPSSSW